MSVTKINHPATLIHPSNVLKLKSTPNNLKTFITNQALLFVKPQAIPVVNIGFNGIGQGHQEFTGDGKYCYANVLAYLVTGDDRYAKNCMSILENWCTVCKEFKGANAPLEAAWGVAAMARSCELLKYTYPKWSGSLESRWITWVKRLLLPHLRGETEKYKLNWGFFNNWHTSITEARLQFGLLCDDLIEVNWCKDRYKDIFNSYVQEDGVTGETLRDSDHCSFGLAGMIHICELFSHQNIDVYSLRNNLIYKCIELHAGMYASGVFPPFLPKNKVVIYKWIQPSAWEIAYNHFVSRKKLLMPHTSKLLVLIRPCNYALHWGYDTITHCHHSVPTK